MRRVCRELVPDDAAAAALVAGAGPHGVYVANALALDDGDGFLLAAGDSARTAAGAPANALVWIGPRGNLVVIGSCEAADDDEFADALVDEILQRRKPWRIAMGPPAVVDALRERLPVRPLACRDQVYYVGDRTTAAAALQRDDVRAASRADRDRLVQATLSLNASDLNVDPARVDRRWLRDTIDERIANGTTQVIGPLGGVRCKLDYGSDGPGGRVLEGVFTFPDERGRGLAAGLVATCLAAAPGPVCLHVGKHNVPARAAYERAGMVAVATCRLLLLP